MPTRRSRIDALENAARALVGMPALHPPRTPITVTLSPATEHDIAMPLRAMKAVRIGPATEHDMAMPITLGPVTVRTSASIDIKVIRPDRSTEAVDPQVGTRLELSMPDTRTAELGFLFMTTTAGATFAEMFVPGQESGVLGAVIGLVWGARKWKRLHGR